MPEEQQPSPLSDAQLEIMQCVWRRGEATVSDVWQEVSAARPVARNTIATLMERLAARGRLSKRAVGNVHLYKPTADEHQTLRGVVRHLVDTAFSGAADRLVMALLEGRGVTAQEADRIAALIEESRKAKRKRRT